MERGFLIQNHFLKNIFDVELKFFAFLSRFSGGMA